MSIFESGNILKWFSYLGVKLTTSITFIPDNYIKVYIELYTKDLTRIRIIGKWDVFLLLLLLNVPLLLSICGGCPEESIMDGEIGAAEGTFHKTAIGLSQRPWEVKNVGWQETEKISPPLWFCSYSEKERVICCELVDSWQWYTYSS